MVAVFLFSNGFTSTHMCVLEMYSELITAVDILSLKAHSLHRRRRVKSK